MGLYWYHSPVAYVVGDVCSVCDVDCAAGCQSTWHKWHTCLFCKDAFFYISSPRNMGHRKTSQILTSGIKMALTQSSSETAKKLECEPRALYGPASQHPACLKSLKYFPGKDAKEHPGGLNHQYALAEALGMKISSVTIINVIQPDDFSPEKGDTVTMERGEDRDT